MSHRHRAVEWILLSLIILIYLTLGILYATLTPPWQSPDEPAHYNYIRHLVEHKRLPILQMGDYDQAYLSEIIDHKFDPAYSIEPIRYEFHQPPLYYLLAAPLFALTGGALLPLRLFSVVLGCGVLIVAFEVGKAVFPNLSWPALGAAAWIALIPQHLAMSSAVQNDALAELVVGGTLLLLVRWLESERAASTGQLIGIGVLIGLGLLTKTGAYITLPLLGLAIWLKFWVYGPPCPAQEQLAHAWQTLWIIGLPALLLGLPWFVRNAVVYGGWDLTGLRRHDLVVMGQLRMSEWIAQHGWANLPSDWLRTAFHSFWAQFGWMAVPIDGRIYTALELLSLVAGVGLIGWLINLAATRARIRPCGILLTCSAAFTLATFIGYNFSFYQAQGRYLFPALIPLSLAWVIGLRWALRRDMMYGVGGALLLVTLWHILGWIIGSHSDKWRIAIYGAAVVAVAARRLGSDDIQDGLLALSYLPLLALCAVSPFWFIIPYLTP